MTRRVHRKLGKLPFLLAVLSLAVCHVTPADAGEKDGERKGGEGREARFAGMVLSIDPETGRLRAPDAEEVLKLRAAMREMFAKLRAARRTQPGVGGEAPVVVPDKGARMPREDGLMSALVGTDHLNYTVASVGPDGEISTHCLNGVHGEAEPAAPLADQE